MTVQVIKPLRYSGEIKIGRWSNNTTFTGYYDPINFTDLSLQPDGEEIVQVDNGITYFGQAKTFAYQPKPTKVMMELDELNNDLLADVIRGVLSTYSQAAAASQSATKTLVLDRWVDIGYMNISNVAITGKVLGTDFEVDEVLGQVRAMNSQTAGSQTIEFDLGAIAGNKIVSGNAAPILFGLKGRVKDHNSGETGVLEVPKIFISPKTAFQVIGNKGNQLNKYEGFVIVPGGGVAPYTFYPDLAMT